MIDDATLLRRYVEDRSEAAFSELVRRHIDLVYSVAFRELHGNAARADDVVQEVFTALARKAPALQHRSSLAGWLHVSVRHSAANLKRSEQRRQYREQEAHAMHEKSSPRPLEAWEKLEPVLNDAIGNLNDTDREAVLLRFYQHRRFHEIGALLRLSENAARHRVDRALEKMRMALQRRGITSTAAALAVLLETNAVTAAPASVAASVMSAALAGGTGVGAMAGFWIFMSTTKVISGVAIAAALLATFSAVHEASRAREALTKLSVVRTELEQHQDRLRSAEKRAQEAQAELIATQRRLNAPSVAAPGPSGGTWARTFAWQPTSPVNFALSDPKARTAFVDQEVSRAKVKFERFFKVAGITSAEQDAVLAALKRFAEARLDLTASVREQGFGPNNPPQDPEAMTAYFNLDSQVTAEGMASIRAVLGDERFKQFYNFQKNLPEWNVADQLASQLYDSNTPLTSDQAQRLVRLLRDTRFDKQATPSPTNTLNGTFIPDSVFVAAVKQSNMMFGDVMMPNMDWHAPVTDAALARAETVFAPAQVAALRRLQAQQLTQLLLAPPPRLPDVPAASPSQTGGK